MTEGPVVETESELDARAQAALRVRGSRRTKVVLPRYAGFATRLVAFMLDAVVINLVAAMTAAGVALALSIFSVQNSTLVHDIQDAAPWLVATVFVVWSVAYFVTFWSTTGQTPGDRVMGIMVLREDEDGHLHAVKAFIRFWAMIACAIPFGAGFLPILTNDRCRGLHDRAAGSVVVRADPPPRQRTMPTPPGAAPV